MLERLWRRDHGDRLVVLGVDTGPDAASDGRRFVQAHGITYPVVFDPNAGIASSQYDLPGLPVTYVLNPQGRIVGDGADPPPRQRQPQQALGQMMGSLRR